MSPKEFQIASDRFHTIAALSGIICGRDSKLRAFLIASLFSSASLILVNIASVIRSRYFFSKFSLLTTSLTISSSSFFIKVNMRSIEPLGKRSFPSTLEIPASSQAILKVFLFHPSNGTCFNEMVINLFISVKINLFFFYRQMYLFLLSQPFLQVIATLNFERW